MNAPETILPWEDPAWDHFVVAHPAGTVYHTSSWCRIIQHAGNYEPRYLILRDANQVKGILPLLLVTSRLTGNRIVCLPFSDLCYPLVEAPEVAKALLARALQIAEKERSGYLEVRGAPHWPSSAAKMSRSEAAGHPQAGSGAPETPVDASATDRSERENAAAMLSQLGFSEQNHFRNYITPLSKDTSAVLRTFHRTSVRQTINKSFRLGVTVRLGQGERDINEFYRLYVMNRRRHGIPPQAKGFFTLMFERLEQHPKALLYIAEYEGKNIAALVVLKYRGVCYAKYEGMDEAYRHLLPVYALFWKSIEDAALDGDTNYDFGRTALDNTGLNAFKNRWGTRPEMLPYYFHPPREGLSVVKSDSLKYRLFTGAVRRLPLSVSAHIGARLFRHFG